MDSRTTFIGAILAVFIGSGVAVPLLIELITLNGGCERSTLMIMLPNSIGMVVASQTKRDTFSTNTPRWPLVVAVAILEMFSQILLMDGLMLAGPTIHTVVYSSVIVYTAIISYFFLGHRLPFYQWVGVFLVMVGLAVVSDGAKADGSEVLLGVLLILIGSFSHAGTYVASEYLIHCSVDPISPHYLCFLLGCIGGCMNLLWQVFYTIPRFHPLVIDQIEKANGNVHTILLSYLVLTIMAGIHALAFYQLLGTIGSVSTGICKGVQSAVTFIGSHFAFCAVQTSQCFTAMKGLSLVLVSCGVFLYSSFAPSVRRTESYISLHDDPSTDDGDDEEGHGFLLRHVLSPATQIATPSAAK